MNDITTTSYNEKDLFIFIQQLRLLTAKSVSENNIERSKNVKEEKATVQGVFKNIGHFFERGTMNYDKTSKEIDEAINLFNEKHPSVIDKETADQLLDTLFAEDKYGLAKLIFATTIILDDEFDYKHVEEGLKEASYVVYGDKTTLLEIKKQLQDNYNAIAPNTLSNVQKGILLGVAASSLVGIMIMPAIAGVGAAAALSAHGVAGVAIESVLLAAAFTGMAYGGMKLYNDIKIKQEFKRLTPEKNALYLAIQCTYVQRSKEILSEDEFKDQLDKILKDLNVLKSDLDYFLYVEKESTKDNKAKEKSFHEFDNRLAKVLGI